MMSAETFDLGKIAAACCLCCVFTARIPQDELVSLQMGYGAIAILDFQ
jgi:hypothetical protein